MRALLLVLALLLAWPETAGAEGLRVIRKSPPSLQNYRSDCRPGRDPSDPHCCADKLAVCRIMCKDDYAENGDMLYLRHCERECEEELRLCKEGRR